MSRACEELHKIIRDPELEHSPILIFANKQDVAGALSQEEVQQQLKMDTIEDHRKRDICF